MDKFEEFKKAYAEAEALRDARSEGTERAIRWVENSSHFAFPTVVANQMLTELSGEDSK